MEETKKGIVHSEALRIVFFFYPLPPAVIAPSDRLLIPGGHVHGWLGYL